VSHRHPAARNGRVCHGDVSVVEIQVVKRSSAGNLCAAALFTPAGNPAFTAAAPAKTAARCIHVRRFIFIFALSTTSQEFGEFYVTRPIAAPRGPNVRLEQPASLTDADDK
jgi:hypothetical protein